MDIMGLSLSELLSALLSIIVINLVLSGDNAIVVGLACRNLPRNLQMKGIVLGSLGAIVVRVIGTFAIMWLLQIPGLRLVGGLALIYIAYKLLAKQEDHSSVKATDSLWTAVLTIVAADVAMGLDNVIAIAAAANGQYAMVVVGLIISVPIIVFGSTIVIKLIEKFPLIVDLGAAIISYTAAKMIAEEPFLHGVFEHSIYRYILYVVAVVGVLAVGRIKAKKSFGPVKHAKETV